MELSKLASKNPYVFSDGCCFFCYSLLLTNDCCLFDPIIKDLVAIMNCLLITMCLSGGISQGSVYPINLVTLKSQILKYYLNLSSSFSVTKLQFTLYTWPIQYGYLSESRISRLTHPTDNIYLLYMGTPLSLHYICRCQAARLA